ncbi:methyltransferase domain-containing protein [Edaphobacter aggregans]|uniref:methyltransferase domain-containing protein n=1 Tax=Edaphobacter aggregans TaxID=570835 RepID=UPI00054D842F|nr:methyltransferase domain-containing protein [Edaphobacter aggregans]
MGHPKFSEAASSACPSCGATNAIRLFSRSLGDKIWYLARCPDCTQYYTDPRPTLDDIKTFYSGGYHADLLSEEETELEFGEKFRGYADWICSYVRPGPSLDIGCTTGLFPYVLKQRGFNAEGLEINEVTARWAEQHYGITVRNEPFETANYSGRSFRLISMADVLEHALHPVTTLLRVYSLLEDGGFAFISFPDIESLESRYFKTLAQMTGRSWLWKCCHIPGHTWEFTKPTAEALFRRCSFRVVGFRRSHRNDFQHISVPITILVAPPLLLGTSLFRERLGTQMEFILQKVSSSVPVASRTVITNP